MNIRHIGTTWPRQGLYLAALLLIFPASARAGAGDWPTARGNMQRTGCLDDKAGPTTPQVLWVYQPKEHFAASPALTDKGILVAGVGVFNTPTLHYLTLETKPAKRELWSKYTPFIRQPVFGGAAVRDGLAVFGDGQHSSPGSALYCLDVETGRLAWQLTKTGRFVHMEGIPTLDQGRVFLGGGNEGVLCVSLRRVVLDGKEQEAGVALATIDKRRRELQVAYEQEKAKDPTFAIPPSEEDLPKPAPVQFWQQGAGKWHVDAPVAVSGQRVLAASAYVEDNRIGWRGLICLNAMDGNTLWETPLALNPWGGPTLAGDLAIVGCSSISADPEQVKTAKGSVAAVDIAGGRVKWQRDVAGGVLSPVAVKDGLAVFTTTDGKVYALDIGSGDVRWTYDGGSAFFAGPAIAGGAVYAADLKGVLHAIALADGKRLWTLDLPADPAVKRPGTVYGAPVVQDGRVYVVTCNFSDPEGLPCSVVCVGQVTHAPASAPSQTQPKATGITTGTVKELTDEYILIQAAGDAPRRYWFKWVESPGATPDTDIRSSVSNLKAGDKAEAHWFDDDRKRLDSIRLVTAAPAKLAGREVGMARPAPPSQGSAAATAPAAPTSLPAPAATPATTLAERVNGWVDNFVALGERIVELPLFMLLAAVATLAAVLALVIRRVSRKPGRSRLVRSLSAALAVLLVLTIAVIMDRKIAHLQDEVSQLRTQSTDQAAALLETISKRSSRRQSFLFDAVEAHKGLGAQFGEVSLRPLIYDEATDIVQVHVQNPLAQAYLAVVDLRNPATEIKLDTTPDRKALTSEFARENGCTVAINGEAGMSPGADSGLGVWRGNLVRLGQVLLREDARAPRPFLSFDRQGRAAFTSAASANRALGADHYNVIWGRSDVLVDGQVQAGDGRDDPIRPPGLDSPRQPRTAMAIDLEKTRLYLLVVDGRQPRYSMGLMRAEVGNLLKAFGAHEGMLCDEGGSSCIYLKQFGGISNTPSDNQGRERPTYTHFGIALRGGENQ